jgi:hypothetical protein
MAGMVKGLVAFSVQVLRTLYFLSSFFNSHGVIHPAVFPKETETQYCQSHNQQSVHPKVHCVFYSNFTLLFPVVGPKPPNARQTEMGIVCRPFRGIAWRNGRLVCRDLVNAKTCQRRPITNKTNKTQQAEALVPVSVIPLELVL